LVAQNVVYSLRKNRRSRRADGNGKLKVGINIPSPDEIRAIIAKLFGPRRPLLLTAIFTGLRASELRGLRWADIDLKRGELHVRQRADRYGKIGRPKSEAWRAHGSAAADGRVHAARAQARLSEQRPRFCLPQQQGPHRSKEQHR